MKTDDLLINGYGTSNGGQFRNVQLNGKGTVNGDVECVDFECNGSGHVNGDIKAETVKISGSGKINGKLDAMQMSIEGSGNIQQDVDVRKIKISGKGTIGGHVSGEDMNVSGKAIIDGNCEVDTFKSEGQFIVGGLLSADDIFIDMHGECKAKEIGGQTINIKYRKSALSWLFETMFTTRMETELIEGDNIIVEYTNTKTIRGNNVTVGPNCEINLIEYTGVCTIDENANVKESRKI
ncbi:polymer-forming cytoskeletal protein [Bacillus sp. BP-3]|uniref:polymer-forming cytoskeletal protein n=1 Tax=Bacillus sp. BP-3 TaxID=3022773 RepID=UPI00232CD3F6|nr:polymer-forming cytoskeletal protein [Bacillus sp. BP-3]MDC2864289.1 polymer-forming cytoskeletal protein [Bacillus sp. BP-3]